MANDPPQHADADHEVEDWKWRSQTFLIRVRTAVVGRQLQNQAEKSRPIENWW
ncbi:MAG: hypothetical protein AAGH40_02720 [Verrucomicrobiota bacterium]